MTETRYNYDKGFGRLPEYHFKTIPEEAPIPFMPVQIGFGKLEIKIQNIIP